MKIDELKSDFHDLIDKINDPGVLIQFFNAINQSVKNDSSLRSSFTADQQKQVLAAYEESEDEALLIPIETIRSKFE